VLISKIRSSVDLTHILFGNLLGITDADLVQTVVISVGCLLVLLLWRRDLLLFCLIPAMPARLASIPAFSITCCSPW
jgi:manganese transport system permease protein